MNENNLEDLHRMLDEAKALLNEYEQYRLTKPSNKWMDRRTGTWARSQIRNLKKAIKEKTSGAD